MADRFIILLSLVCSNSTLPTFRPTKSPLILRLKTHTCLCGSSGRHRAVAYRKQAVWKFSFHKKVYTGTITQSATIQWAQGALYPEVRQSLRATGHHPLSSAHVKNQRSYNSNPHAFTDCTGSIYLFFILQVFPPSMHFISCASHTADRIWFNSRKANSSIIFNTFMKHSSVHEKTGVRWTKYFHSKRRMLLIWYSSLALYTS